MVAQLAIRFINFVAKDWWLDIMVDMIVIMASWNIVNIIDIIVKHIVREDSYNFILFLTIESKHSLCHY